MNATLARAKKSAVTAVEPIARRQERELNKTDIEANPFYVAAFSEKGNAKEKVALMAKTLTYDVPTRYRYARAKRAFENAFTPNTVLELLREVRLTRENT